MTPPYDEASRPRAMVGVDVGGTKVAAAVVDSQGAAGPVHTVPTRAHGGPEQVLDVIAEAVRTVRAQAAEMSVVGVGVGAAGIIDAASGTVVSATQAITAWAGTEVALGLRERTGLPTVVDNDVNAHAAGEAWRGAGQGARTMLMLAVGTGVGGAVVLDGRPLHGRHGAGGEIGHIPAPGSAGHLRCACGRLGHIEAIASGPGILAHFRSLGGPLSVFDTREVLRLAKMGDDLARRAVADSAMALGAVIAGLVTTIDPDVVVIGGGVAEAGPVWWDPMERSMRRELVDVLATVALHPAELGSRAPLVGAAYRAWTELENEAADPRETSR